jgi:amidohydrolase
MLAEAKEMEAYIIDTRRKLHEHPELSYQEYETQEFVHRELSALDGVTARKIAKTGILADLKKGEGPCIALRADLDALPLQEETGLPFASKKDNIMHACGHDAHTAMLLGAARVLVDTSFQGTVRFLFQPSEENNFNDPDGWSGAERMINEGALDGVDAIIGMHQRPEIEAGTIGIQSGPVMASADMFQINVHGKSSHAGAAPEKGIDAIFIAGQLVSMIQSIPSRKISPKETAVISVGTIKGGQIANIIADKVEMTGTMRALQTEARSSMREELFRMFHHLGKMHKTEIEYIDLQNVPLTFNDAQLAQQVYSSACKLVEANQIRDDIHMLAAEDFAFYGQRTPAFFGFLGTRVKDGGVYGLHHPKMQLEESVLYLGSAFLSQVALDFLR